ncbi:hypothetical protein ATB98_16500 [Sinorhizobium saheli]|uniref:Anti-sigma factor NepR domain-containing protein n=2 Tax=Sinorhizobium saheli TaxID=36856 RepID=A0A178YRU9_SINSA|nr:hypothetical protein ATB98_16500 [Sinorhizobium saheli]
MRSRHRSIFLLPHLCDVRGFHLTAKCSKDGRMSDTKAPANPDADETLDRQIALLMEEVRRETVPSRLLELARKLQKALDDRKG